MALVSRTTMPVNHAKSEVEPASDESLASLPPDWPRDVPLARVRTCGRLVVEVVIDLIAGPHGHLEPVYGPPEAGLLKIPGMSTAFLLLAELSSRPDGFASKDFLMQTLPSSRRKLVAKEESDQVEDRVLTRPDNVVSLLRKLLYPPKLRDVRGAQDLRQGLVRYVGATDQSGPGYRLASFPLLWLDVEAMEAYVKEARCLEEHGEDGLEQWQAVYEIGMRGQFLEHEPYSDWADWRRLRVADLLWQSVNAQCKRAQGWGNETHGVEAAQRLLFDFWQRYQTNEDAFRALIEVLGKQGRFQQAEECYAQLCAALDREGYLPHKRTREMMNVLRTTRIEQDSQQSLLPTPRADERVVEGTGERGSEEQETTDQRIVHETRHLIGREKWLAGVQQMVQQFPAKKLIVLQGPVGVGKSSELIRLADAFQDTLEARYRVIWLPLRAAEATGGPEAALDVFLGTVLSECGMVPFPSETPRSKLISAWLTHLEKPNRPTVILLDNAECCLEENGTLATCWESFIDQFISRRHQATILLATKEWQGWPGRNSAFIAETFVPPLTAPECVSLLQRLGLEEVPEEQLETLGRRMTGIPLLLEWTAKLVIDPLQGEDWEGLDEGEMTTERSTTQGNIVKRLSHLLADPSLLGEHLANRLTPLLQRILEKYLSDEARLVLTRLSVATIPLGKAALRVLCPRMQLLKELRSASLLVRYTNRFQLLPVVASMVCLRLTPEQVYAVEEEMIGALKKWLYDENINSEDAGNVVAELVTLQLRHHHLGEAAELVIYHGWLSFKLGHGPRLAYIAQDVLRNFDWHSTDENECAGLALIQLLFPFLGKPVVTREHGDYQRIYDGFLAGKVILPIAMEQYAVRLLLLDSIKNVQFEKAQSILDAYGSRIATCHPVCVKRQTALLTEQAYLFGIWCEYMEEQGERQKARALRERTIALYRQQVIQDSSLEGKSSIIRDLDKKGLGHDLSYLGYHLNRAGQNEEALQVIERAITLQEQGYAYVGVLASSYSDKSQILLALGRFQEAIIFDKKAVAEIQRCAYAGYGLAQEEIPIYYVNRGRLYLRLGRVDEAKQILEEALPCISEQRRKYRMFAREALDEIKQWRQHAVAPRHQLDWRWIGRFRELVAYDGFWWLTGAGPFTAEEQQEWDRLFALPLDKTTKEQLGAIMKVSRERELNAALDEQREPSLQYPAIPIEDVRRKIAGLLQLDTDIQQQEQNAIVRRLYQEVIGEDVAYLRLIEATYEEDTEQFWECSQRVFISPNVDEVNYALTQIARLIRRGLAKPETADIGQQLEEMLRTRFHLSFDFAQDEEVENRGVQSTTPSLPSQANRKVSAQTAKRFFEAVLRESGYDEWQVVIETGAIHEWIESGLHLLVLPEQQFTLADIKGILTHELAGHAARSMAGEHSLLGLLGIQTKNYQPTEEGLIIYYGHQDALRDGREPSSEGAEWSAFAVGLASGVITPPQTFLSVATFFELLVLLYGLLKWPDAEMQKARTPVGAYARTYGLMMAQRVFRGVPDLSHAGVCFLQDAMYLRGMRLIQQAVAEDVTVLDRLAVGKCALDQLPDLQELGIVAPPQSLRKLVDVADLYDYILSFECEDQKAVMDH
jgi:tetratricopeptide (TPR) repeat protein